MSAGNGNWISVCVGVMAFAISACGDEVPSPECGDGVVDVGEACDDGNDFDGDGCSALCESEDVDGDGDGFVASADCDDSDPAIHPDAVEICDSGVDNDCDGLVDDADDSLDASTTTMFYADADSDSYGDSSSSQAACAAPAGFVADSGDCDDGDSAIHPAATEVCDGGIDNDCSGAADDDDRGLAIASATTWYADTDTDTYGDDSVSSVSCVAPSGYVAVAGDCDDGDGAIHPDATEVCDGGVDNDCSGQSDDDDGNLDMTTASVFYLDSDLDSFGDPAVTQQACVAPMGYVVDNTDCNDGEIAINPAATEVCDSDIDNNCNGLADIADPTLDPSSSQTFYADVDSDTFGDPNVTLEGCSLPAGYVADNSDCNDNDGTIRPGAVEICDGGVDNNCNGSADDADETLDTTTATTFYADTDSDSFGDGGNTDKFCVVQAGYVADNTDCDDSDGAINPNATEVCDLADNNCSGLIDIDDPALDPTSSQTFYADADTDGFGDPAVTQESCGLPAGYVANPDDCNDGDIAINPAATEVCDSGIDNNCNGSADDADATLDATTGSTFYADADSDTFGDPGASVMACLQPAGHVTDSQDCNDGDAAIKPGALEICDGGIDNDCNALADDADPGHDPATESTFYLDADSDNFGSPATTTTACAVPAGYAVDNTDCNDGDGAINPGAPEVCDGGVDNNCNLLADDADATLDTSTGTVFYADTDSDAFGDPGNTVQTCLIPAGYSTDNTDCNDGDAAIKPGATEVCDGGIDNNCNALADDADSTLDMGTTSVFYRDIDSDSFGNNGMTTNACVAPSGYVSDNTDCVDNDAAINPAATEVCDGGVDNNCNGSADDADGTLDPASRTRWYDDVDLDGFGHLTSGVDACVQPAGQVADNTDCNDGDIAINPAAAEVCDGGVDNNCNGDADDGDATLDPGSSTTYYADTDSDTYGDAAATQQGCTQPAGFVVDSTDCNDGDGAINPGATEVCDGGIDNDCDGDADDADASVDVTTYSTFYADSDSDSYGDAASTSDACAAPAGYVADATDCNDGDGAINPGASEVCDGGVDNNCNGDADDADATLDLASATTFYHDGDSDTYGDPLDSEQKCIASAGYITDQSDCNDADALINPAATEVCDGGVDNDCSGLADDADAGTDPASKSTFYADTDSDTYGDLASTQDACLAPAGFVADSTDCNDGDGAINPGATEVCDGGVDNDCSGDADDADAGTDPASMTTFFADSDSDTFGDAAVTQDACLAPVGYVADNADCNDGDNSISPAATEVCDGGVDNDCDGVADDADGGTDPASMSTFYADSDSDSYGDAAVTQDACEAPAGHVADNTDCNDADDLINPAAAEVCDNIDNDCDAGTVESGVGFDDGSGAVDITASFSGSAGSPATYVANTDGDIYVCSGTYFTMVEVGANVDITGLAGAGSTVLDAEASGAVVRVTAAGVAVSLTDVTLTDGTGFTSVFGNTGGGGAHCAVASDLTLDGVVISGNSAPTGGGLYFEGCDVVAVDTTITGNTGLTGGGLLGANATLDMTNGAVDGNTSTGTGGGVYAYAFAGGTNTMSFTNTSVSSNDASFDGGGLLMNATGGSTNDVTMVGDNTADMGMFGNSALDGGAVAIEITGSSTLTTTDVDFGSDADADNNSPNDIDVEAGTDYEDDVSMVCNVTGCTP